MNGEIALHGIFVPTLLVIGLAAAIATAMLQRLADRAGFYRLVSYRALVDLALFVIVFGAFVALASRIGFAP